MRGQMQFSSHFYALYPDLSPALDPRQTARVLRKPELNHGTYADPLSRSPRATPEPIPRPIAGADRPITKPNDPSSSSPADHRTEIGNSGSKEAVQDASKEQGSAAG
ncbi:hypothetical protein BDY21DRAFT_330907 [Lineolata rhizophorae]|uniref:Uncharacterized protein n=1 Tax=Lineolata rhizophorae TaxID=578093 RepID=A0A6A6PE54_9PEZI|nr:hypothetical protein BDY21DRAFT_330907 [Lineolata rhizophorae]